MWAPSRALRAIGRAVVAGTPELPIFRIASRRCRDVRADRHDGACEHPGRAGLARSRRQ